MERGQGKPSPYETRGLRVRRAALLCAMLAAIDRIKPARLQLLPRTGNKNVIHFVHVIPQTF